MPAPTPALRPLNLLDIRSIARILKEANLTQQDLAAIIKNVLETSKTPNNPAALSDALAAGAVAALDILADSDAFYAFAADLYGVKDAAALPPSALKNLLSAIWQDTGIYDFFQSLPQTTPASQPPQSPTTS